MLTLPLRYLHTQPSDQVAWNCRPTPPLTVPAQAHRTQDREVIIVTATCMPVGSINGIVTLKHALEQLKVDPRVVEEIYFGIVVQAGCRLVANAPGRVGRRHEPQR